MSSTTTTSTESCEPKCLETEEQKRKEYLRFDSQDPSSIPAGSFVMYLVDESLEFPKNLTPEVNAELVKNLTLGLMEMAKLFEAPAIQIGKTKIICNLLMTYDYHGYSLLSGYTKNLFTMSEQISKRLPSFKSEDIARLLQNYTPVLIVVNSEPSATRYRRAIHIMSIGASSSFFEVDSGRITILENVDNTMVTRMPQDLLNVPPAILEYRMENQLYYKFLRHPYCKTQFNRMGLLKSLDIVSFDTINRGEGMGTKGRAVVSEVKESIAGETDFYLSL